MAKPPFLEDDDEEDALSLVLGEGGEEAAEGEGLEEAPLEAAETEPKSDPNQVLDEVVAKLEELRGLVTSL